MQTKQLLAVSLVAAAQITSACPPAANGTAPSNWLYTSEFDDAALKILDRSDINGIQVLYSWKSLEKSKDEYDFSHLKASIELARAKGKGFWLQIQDRSFNKNNDPVPKYLNTPYYNNGSAPTCDGSDCDTNFVIGGHVAQQWNPRVRERFQALLAAMARNLDGSLYGINLAETSIEVDVTKNNYTHTDYFLGELENAKYAAGVFNKTFVVQYVNFWPDGWADENGRLTTSFDFYAKHHVGVGGPDLIPEKKSQLQNSYPFLRRYRNKLPISVIAVQEPDLEAINPNTSVPFTKQEFVDYATNYLGSNIIFWAQSSPWLA